ncbi:mechanosensitive ion channel family protein [Uliginosibacterium sp. H3]|uniref:Mechanosensitive ion channel family protein n=1 Tax=Uliginosibacterium silvisoli TaxID=3114758 RepID=A0ABU6K817_9RHOO|nr:mechanosensitive ion channel family protein [Uliginosibacterium sp. H3]
MNDVYQYLGNLSQTRGWIGTGCAALLLIALATVIHASGAAILRRIALHSVFVAALIKRIKRPSRLVIVLFALEFAWRLAPDALVAIDKVRHINTVCLIAAITWLATAWVMALADTMIALHPINVEDNLQARRILTQTRVLSRSIISLLVLLGVSFALLTLPGARQVGASILASAGIAGVVAGMAARPVLGNFIAGLQLAFTQPLRIDDVLIVEGEWGRVEEITGSYVVMALWDERRLIVPLQWFIEKPFQNWTRSTSTLLGTVMLWLDYRAPLDKLRAELERRCHADPDWDGRVCILQVTDATEHTMQVRLLVSSANASRGFDLRCRMREALIDYMQNECPEALPVTRVAMPRAEAEPSPVVPAALAPSTPAQSA